MNTARKVKGVKGTKVSTRHRLWRAFLAIAVGIPVVIALAVGAVNLYDWNKARGAIAHYSEKWLGWRVEVGGDLLFRIGLHPHLRAHDVTVKKVAQKTDPLFTGGYINVRMDLLPLFNRRFVFAGLEVEDSHLTLPVSPAEPPQQNNQASKTEEKSFFDHFQIFLGEATIRRSIFTRPQILTAAVDQLTIYQNNDNRLVVQGAGTVNGLNTEVDGFVGNYLKTILGEVNANGQINIKMDEMVGNASFSLPKGPTIVGMTSSIKVSGKHLERIFAAFNFPLSDKLGPTELSAQVYSQENSWGFDPLVLKIGPSQAAGSAKIGRENATAPLAIDVDLTSPKFRFADIGAFLPKAVAKELPVSQKDEKPGDPNNSEPKKLFSSAALPSAGSKNLELDLKFAVDSFEGPEKAALIDAFKVHFQAKNGTVRVDPLVLNLGQGKVSSVISYETQEDKSGDPTNARVVKLDLKLSNVPLGPLAASYLSDAGFTQKKVGNVKVKSFFEGVLNGQIKVVGDGASFAQVMGNLNGRADLVVQDGKMSSLVIEALGMDITESVGVLAAKNQLTNMECLLIGLDAKKGQIEPRLLLASTADSNVIVKGTLNLQDETSDATIETYPKDFSIGAVRTPIKINGPFTKLHVDVDRQAAAERVVLGALLAALVHPAAALVALVEPGTETKQCSDYVVGLNKVAVKVQPKLGASRF